MEKTSNKKNTFIGIFTILFYFISYIMAYDILKSFGINYDKLNITNKSICLIIYNIIILLIIIGMNINDIKNNVKEYKVKYFTSYIKYWFIAIGLMVISNSIVTIFTTSSTSINQQEIIKSLKLAPIYTIISAVLIAPIMEEIVFRLSIKKIIKNDILYIIISGLFFGLIHVLSSLTNIIDLLFLIPYSIPGCIFAYTYVKSKNICVPISLHFIHNLVIMIIQLLI